jgi:hypothetical protein
MMRDKYSYKKTELKRTKNTVKGCFSGKDARSFAYLSSKGSRSKPTEGTSKEITLQTIHLNENAGRREGG